MSKIAYPEKGEIYGHEPSLSVNDGIVRVSGSEIKSICQKDKTRRLQNFTCLL